MSPLSSPLRPGGRTARAAAAGLLGLLLAAPPPATADDDLREPRRYAGRDRDDRGEWRGYRPPVGREHPARRGVREGQERREWQWDRREGDRREGDRREGDRREGDRKEGRDRDEHRDRKERSHFHRHDRPHDHAWHWHDGRWCPPGHRHAPGRRLGWLRERDDRRWARYRRPLVVHSPFYCAPCGYWSRDRRDFDAHVHGFHELPTRLASDAIAQLAWGSVYFGR